MQQNCFPCLARFFKPMANDARSLSEGMTARSLLSCNRAKRSKACVVTSFSSCMSRLTYRQNSSSETEASDLQARGLHFVLDAKFIQLRSGQELVGSTVAAMPDELLQDGPRAVLAEELDDGRPVECFQAHSRRLEVVPYGLGLVAEILNLFEVVAFRQGVANVLQLGQGAGRCG